MQSCIAAENPERAGTENENRKPLYLRGKEIGKSRKEHQEDKMKYDFTTIMDRRGKDADRKSVV